jgi:hypothetical protein
MVKKRCLKVASAQGLVRGNRNRSVGVKAEQVHEASGKDLGSNGRDPEPADPVERPGVHHQIINHQSCINHAGTVVRVEFSGQS